MPSTKPLLERLQALYSDLTFHAGERFEWHPHDRVIVYDPDDPEFDAHLLHEVGHAVLNHDAYERDIDLIAMERDAWQTARMDLCPRFGVTIDGDIIHHDMDTYRDWLHQRSTCPHCSSSGIQVKKDTYKCVTCRGTWRVNEARNCQLRRWKT